MVCSLFNGWGGGAGEGIIMNEKKLRRLCREEKLQVRKRGGRKRALGTRFGSVSSGRAAPELQVEIFT